MMHFNKNLFDMKAGLCNPGKARQGKARQGTTLETLLGPEPPEPAVCSSKTKGFSAEDDSTSATTS